MASTAFASFTILFSVCVTWTLIGILGKAAGGKVASSDVIALILFATVNYLPTILILTSFISVLMVVTRSYRDSEMVVWFASGLSLTRWIAPVLTFGLPMVLLTAALSFVAAPWAKEKSTEYVERFAKREDLQGLARPVPRIVVGQPHLLCRRRRRRHLGGAERVRQHRR